jgi:hypothetical protein
MNLVKENKVVFAVVLPILILVLVKSFGSDHFRNDSRKLAGPSVKGSNILTNEQLETIAGNKLVINLDKKNSFLSELKSEIVNIPADSVLTGGNLDIIHKYKGSVLLYSAKQEVSAGIWMVLSQMGYENLYILTTDPDNEVNKNKFRPDTLVRPEL